MFIVIEFQTDKDGNLGNIVTPYSEQAEAESKYYQILSHAALSSVPIHTAMVITSEGLVIMNKCYQHPVEVQPENQ